ncbi:hypothetical protein D9M72_349160 [compost metagenome]
MFTQKSAPASSTACSDAVLFTQISSDGGSVESESTAVADMAKRSRPLLVVMMVTDLARRRIAWSIAAFRSAWLIALPSCCSHSEADSSPGPCGQHRPRGLVRTPVHGAFTCGGEFIRYAGRRPALRPYRWQLRCHSRMNSPPQESGCAHSCLRAGHMVHLKDAAPLARCLNARR